MIRNVSYRIDVLRNGVPYTRLDWDSTSPPQIYAQKDATLHLSLSGSFIPNADVNFLADELQPIMTIDGREYPLGIFQTTTKKDNAISTGRRIEIEAYDRCWRVYNNKTDHILHLSAGSSYIAEVRKLLFACGIVMVIATPNDATLQTDREDWKAGTSYLTICNDLLAEINYESIWFDASGVCRLTPYREPNAENINWRYGESGSSIISHPSAEYSDEEDLFDAPNVFVVTCSNPDLDTAMVATAVNDNPASRKSTFRRGMRIVSVSTVKNIASQEDLQAYANRLRDESMMSTRIIKFYTLAEPSHGNGDILALTHSEIGGIYLETGWQMNLAPGELMAHSAKRTVIA